MGGSEGVAVGDVRSHAERLLTGPVSLHDQALAFSESSAASAEVLVEGRQFYPPMLEDIRGATSSIHINQFGFRPGIVGDRFSEALVEKAKEGVPIRLVVDRQGSAPEEAAREHYERLVAAGVQVCVVRATKPRARTGPLGGAHGLSLGLQGAGRFSTERILPLYERYPLGGASTLRGFDEEAMHVDKFALSRLEWRFFLDSGAQHVYLFWDHAETSTRESEPAGGDRLVYGRFDGVGAGLRLGAAGGVVGIDYGLEPGRPFLEGKIHLQLVTHF